MGWNTDWPDMSHVSDMEPGCGSAAIELHRLREGRGSPNKRHLRRRGNNKGGEKQKMPPKLGGNCWQPTLDTFGVKGSCAIPGNTKKI